MLVGKVIRIAPAAFILTFCLLFKKARLYFVVSTKNVVTSAFATTLFCL